MKGNVYVVVDHADEPSLSIELSRRADPPAGVVVVRPIPGVTTRTELAADLLIALGKRFDALERERKRPQAWRLAQQWLQAEQTRHVVIIDADRLPANLWADLAALTCHVPATIWLVAAAPPTPAQADAAPQFRTTLSPAHLLDTLPSAPPAALGGPDVEGPIPDDDFFTFRAACRDLLPKTRFEPVDLIYRTVNTETFDAVRRLPIAQLRQGEAIIGRLRELASRSAGPTETIVAFRAAQAAFFTKGVLVNLTLKEPGRDAVQTIGLTPQVATKLRRLVTPELVAAYALSAAHEQLDPSQLTMESITPEWRAITGPPTLPIPEHGRALIGVHMLERRRRGAQRSDPLFVTHAGTAAKTDIVRRMIDKAGDLAEVAASSSVINSRWHTAGIRAWNVDITEIWTKHAIP